MNEEKKVIINIVDSEIETLKFVFADCVNDFYEKYDNRVSLRHEKICKYISIVSDLIQSAREFAEEIKHEN